MSTTCEEGVLTFPHDSVRDTYDLPVEVDLHFKAVPDQTRKDLNDEAVSAFVYAFEDLYGEDETQVSGELASGMVASHPGAEVMVMRGHRRMGSNPRLLVIVRAQGGFAEHLTVLKNLVEGARFHLGGNLSIAACEVLFPCPVHDGPHSHALDLTVLPRCPVSNKRFKFDQLLLESCNKLAVPVDSAYTLTELHARMRECATACHLEDEPLEAVSLYYDVVQEVSENMIRVICKAYDYHAPDDDVAELAEDLAQVYDADGLDWLRLLLKAEENVLAYKADISDGLEVTVAHLWLAYTEMARNDMVVTKARKNSARRLYMMSKRMRLEPLTTVIIYNRLRAAAAAADA